MDSPTPISKIGLDHYLKNYAEYLAPFKDRPFTILEIGIAGGDSLTYWRDSYPNATVIGVDINPYEPNDSSGRVFAYQGKQQDTGLLDKIAATHAPDGFDIVIDDGSHIGHYTRLTFWHLMKKHMRSGGLYFIEDWGTSYWPMYPDGMRHHPKKIDSTFLEKFFGAIGNIGFIQNTSLLRKITQRLEFKSMQKVFPSQMNGMVGFVKELVDEAGIQDATDERFGNPPQRKPIFEWMRVSVGHVIVKKS